MYVCRYVLTNRFIITKSLFKTIPIEIFPATENCIKKKNNILHKNKNLKIKQKKTFTHF